MVHHTNSRISTIRLRHLIEKQRNKERPTLFDYLHAVVNESKHDGNYENAEEVFGLFLKHLNYAVPLRPHKHYLHDEIIIFQRTICTLVRYAPGPQKALDYSSYLLDQAPPLRTEHVEATCLINLIFVYKEVGTSDAMDKALQLIQVGLDRKVYAIEARMKHERDNVAEVFVQVSRKVLIHHQLQFSADKKSLEPFHWPTRPQRFSTF